MPEDDDLPDDFDPEPDPVDTRCTVCGVNWVDANDGYDTCPDCLRRM